MTKKLVCLAVMLCVFAASCAKTAAPKSEPSAGNAMTAPKSEPTGVAAKSQGGKSDNGATAAAPAGPSIPAGAEWTIYCTTIPGASHVLQATQLRDQLARGTGMRDWYVIHGAEDSTLYYGFYKTIDNTAKATRQKIDAMTDTSGARPFRNAVIVELTAPDPDAPPQWDLANAPAGMVWSVQIAAYEGSPQRKKYAVDAVREARAQGIPAFFYHGPSISSVCIGAWPKAAVRGEMEPAFNDPAEKRPLDQIMQQQPADLIVLPPGMPAAGRDIRGKDNRRVRAVASQLEPVDPTLLGTLKTYPNHYCNGEPEGMNTKNGVQPKPTFLVKIPRRTGSILGGGDGALAGSTQTGQGAGPAGPASVAPQGAAEKRPAPAPGYGKLPSLGGN